MNETILSWNVTNWITILLMATVGFFLIGTVAKFAKSHSASN